MCQCACLPIDPLYNEVCKGLGHSRNFNRFQMTTGHATNGNYVTLCHASFRRFYGGMQLLFYHAYRLGFHKILYITGCGLSLLKLLQKSGKYDSITENNTADNNVGESTRQTDNPGPTGIGLRFLCIAPARVNRDRIR